MSKRLLLIPLFLILIVGSCSTVANQSGVDEIALQQAFIESVDGDYTEITFEDSLDGLGDDVLHYVDAFLNDTDTYADNYTLYQGTLSGGTLDATYSVGGFELSFHNASEPAEVNVTFSIPVSTDVQVEGFSLHFYGVTYNDAFGVGTIEKADLYIKNDSGTWVDVDDITIEGVNLADWTNYTTYNPDYWTTTIEVCIVVESSDARPHLAIDYLAAHFYYMTNADADHYAEGFAGVSDWGVVAGETPTSDGDLGTFTTEGDDAWNVYYWNTPSMSFEGHYIEIGLACNNSVNDVFGIVLKDADSYGGSTIDAEYIELSDTNFHPYKYYIEHDTVVESIGLLLRASPSPAEWTIDHLRIGPSDEMGWSHDGSTTEATTTNGNDGTWSVSSDGDIMSYSGDSSDWGVLDFVVDTTATVSTISKTDYPLLAVRWNASTSQSLNIKFRDENGVWTGSTAMTETNSFVTSYFNIGAKLTGNYLKDVRFVDGTNGLQDFDIDYVQAYGIANWTITQSASNDVDDYCYVDSGALVVSDPDAYAEYFTLDYDPTLSIATSYPVVNLSSSSVESWNYVYFRTYDTGWNTWTNGDWRDSTNADGTITDIQITIYGALTLENIKFIEDATAPAVVRSWANPPDPDDSESVTVSAVITDSVEVYTVKINAIVSPAGFSDVDYSLTEGSNNLWSYEFSTLTAGHYTFTITASDGANTNSMTEFAYIDFEARESGIDLSEIEYEGAPDVYTQMQVRFISNKAGNWSVTEWKETDYSDAAETQTGVVIDGYNNIAWDKLAGYADQVVYYNMTVTSGALSETVKGQYSVAKTTFYLIGYPVVTSNSETVTVSGRITKAATYTVLDNSSTIQATGTITDLDFKITFEQWLRHTGQMIYYKIVFTNGSQTTTFESEYEAVKPLEEYEGRAVGEPSDAAVDRARIEFWSFITAVLAGIGVIILLVKELKGRM